MAGVDTMAKLAAKTITKITKITLRPILFPPFIPVNGLCLKKEKHNWLLIY
jgi:hypothetical protein